MKSVVSVALLLSSAGFATADQFTYAGTGELTFDIGIMSRDGGDDGPLFTSGTGTTYDTISDMNTGPGLSLDIGTGLNIAGRDFELRTLFILPSRSRLDVTGSTVPGISVGSADPNGSGIFGPSTWDYGAERTTDLTSIELNTQLWSASGFEFSGGLRAMQVSDDLEQYIEAVAFPGTSNNHYTLTDNTLVGLQVGGTRQFEIAQRHRIGTSFSVGYYVNDAKATYFRDPLGQLSGAAPVTDLSDSFGTAGAELGIEYIPTMPVTEWRLPSVTMRSTSTMSSPLLPQ